MFNIKVMLPVLVVCLLGNALCAMEFVPSATDGQGAAAPMQAGQAPAVGRPRPTQPLQNAEQLKQFLEDHLQELEGFINHPDSSDVMAACYLGIVDGCRGFLQAQESLITEIGQDPGELARFSVLVDKVGELKHAAGEYRHADPADRQLKGFLMLQSAEPIGRALKDMHSYQQLNQAARDQLITLPSVLSNRLSQAGIQVSERDLAQIAQGDRSNLAAVARAVVASSAARQGASVVTDGLAQAGVPLGGLNNLAALAGVAGVGQNAGTRSPFPINDGTVHNFEKMDLFIAAYDGDMDKLRHVIDTYPQHLELRDENGATPLVYAVWGFRTGNAHAQEASIYLLQKGANYTVHYGDEILEEALKKEDQDPLINARRVRLGEILAQYKANPQATIDPVPVVAAASGYSWKKLLGYAAGGTIVTVIVVNLIKKRQEQSQWRATQPAIPQPGQ